MDELRDLSSGGAGRGERRRSSAAGRTAAGPTAAGRTILGSGLPPSMAQLEEQAIRAALAHFDGNRRKAAEHLGIGVRTLYEKIKRLGLRLR